MASSKIPPTFCKMVVQKLSQNFRQAAKIVEHPIVKPGAKEILVRNRYLGINASEINFSSGRYSKDHIPPFDAGFEGVGHVVEVGQECKGIKVGQPVAFLHSGAFSEYLTLPAKVAIPIPVLKPEFLPLLVSGLTAAISLDKVGELKAGETVLITAAAGGTGQFAVQWAKAAGCHVIGTCSTDEKVQFLKDIGCDRPINYKKEDLKSVLRTEYPKGLDVVYETVGGEMYELCVNRLAEKGRLIIIGYISGYESDSGMAPGKADNTLPSKLLSKSASVRGFLLFHYAKYFAEYVQKLAEGVMSGKLRSTVDNGSNSPQGPFSGLESIYDAVDYLYSRKSIGKIYVELPEGSVSSRL